MTAPNFLILRKAGALRNGSERGKGNVWHAVAPEGSYCGAALCGAQPAIQWSSGEGPQITCHRCCSKLAEEFA